MNLIANQDKPGQYRYDAPVYIPVARQVRRRTPNPLHAGAIPAGYAIYETTIKNI